ncbi:hypothetical protein B296_00003120 [Ensete ventricosum]|uniref:Uncharacterized protein n=1 Tax=Ensete ventricosum TaxID=4639 RepID=A0A427AWY4_ENSVE|nr:hypothetical protein B296_00003120 [Ensete ventricosum]
MSETDVLVSPHGAQLTNLFLMDKNSSIMELYPKGWKELAGVGQYVYHWMADWAGMQHKGSWRDPQGEKCQHTDKLQLQRQADRARRGTLRRLGCEKNSTCSAGCHRGAACVAVTSGGDRGLTHTVCSGLPPAENQTAGIVILVGIGRAQSRGLSGGSGGGVGRGSTSGYRTLTSDRDPDRLKWRGLESPTTAVRFFRDANCQVPSILNDEGGLVLHRITFRDAPEVAASTRSTLQNIKSNNFSTRHDTFVMIGCTEWVRVRLI